jgi:hypothetical protein
MSKILTREAFENAIRTTGRHRRLDQRGDPPDRDRRPHGREAHGRRLRPPGQRDALPREPAALGQVPDGGLLLRRRPARGDEGDPSALHLGASPPTASTMGENIADARQLQPDVIKTMAKPFKAEGRHRGAARQPGAARRGHQAQRGDAGADAAHAAAPWCSRTSRTSTPASTTSRSTSTRPASWC